MRTPPYDPCGGSPVSSHLAACTSHGALSFVLQQLSNDLLLTMMTVKTEEVPLH